MSRGAEKWLQREMEVSAEMSVQGQRRAYRGAHRNICCLLIDPWWPRRLGVPNPISLSSFIHFTSSPLCPLSGHCLLSSTLIPYNTQWAEYSILLYHQGCFCHWKSMHLHCKLICSFSSRYFVKSRTTFEIMVIVVSYLSLLCQLCTPTIANAFFVCHFVICVFECSILVQMNVGARACWTQKYRYGLPVLWHLYHHLYIRQRGLVTIGYVSDVPKIRKLYLNELAFIPQDTFTANSK